MTVITLSHYIINCNLQQPVKINLININSIVERHWVIGICSKESIRKYLSVSVVELSQKHTSHAPEKTKAVARDYLAFMLHLFRTRDVEGWRAEGAVAGEGFPGALWGWSSPFPVPYSLFPVPKFPSLPIWLKGEQILRRCSPFSVAFSLNS